MTKLAYRTLSNRMVGKLEVEKDTVFWDRELTGFGVRVYPTGSKVYIAQARGPEGPKRVAVGRQGVIHAEEARKRAALIISRIKAGEAPVPEPLIARRRAERGRASLRGISRNTSRCGVSRAP